MQLIKISPIAGAILATLLSACGGKGDDPAPVAPPAINVSGISLSKTTPRAIAESAVQFDGGVCSGGTGTLTATWDFGDGTGASSSNTHTYAETAKGANTVTVTCTDTAGTAAKAATFGVTVASAAMNGFLGKTWSTYASLDAMRPSLYPVAGLSSSGDIFGVWLPSLANNLDVAASTTNFTTSTWTASEALSTGTEKPPFNDTLPGGRTAAIDMAVSPNGHVMAAWMAGSSIWYATKNGLSGAWSTPAKQAVPVLDASIKVVVNDAGDGAIAYCTSNGAEVITVSGQATQAPVTISKQCGVLDSLYTVQRHRAFDIAMDAASPTIYAVGINDATTPGKSVVNLKSYTPGAGWTAATPVSDEVTTAPASLSYSRSPNGNYAAVAWNQIYGSAPFKSNVYARTYANGTWGDIKAVQDDYITKDYTRPMIAVNDSGDTFLAIQLNNETYATQTEVSVYNAATAPAAWSKPFQLSNKNFATDTRFKAADIAIDKWGTGLITSSKEDGSVSWAGTFTKTGEWSGYSMLWAPISNKQAFHYQTMRALPDGRAILVTSIYDDVTPLNKDDKPFYSGYVLLK